MNTKSLVFAVVILVALPLQARLMVDTDNKQTLQDADIASIADKICGIPQIQGPLSGSRNKSYQGVKVAAIEFSPELVNAANWSRNDRVQMTCEMRKAFLNKYALIDQKKSRLKVDVHLELARCVMNEYNTSTKTSLEYLDSMRRCLAVLQDGHVDLKSLLNLPFVYTGIVLNEHRCDCFRRDHA